jgi:hypothetical protein
MSKEIVQPTVRIEYKTMVGVHLVIESYPNAVCNNRNRIVGLEYDNVYTNVSLNTFDSNKVNLIQGIGELEEEDLGEDALENLKDDLRGICTGINAMQEFSRILATILNSRHEVLKLKEA